jgi:hypothetical protein
MFLSLVDVTLVAAFGVALLMTSLYSGGHSRSNGLRRNGENGARMRKNGAGLHSACADDRVKPDAIRAKTMGLCSGTARQTLRMPKLKLKHWCGLQAILARKAAPVLEFVLSLRARNPNR